MNKTKFFARVGGALLGWTAFSGVQNYYDNKQAITGETLVKKSVARYFNKCLYDHYADRNLFISSGHPGGTKAYRVYTPPRLVSAASDEIHILTTEATSPKIRTHLETIFNVESGERRDIIDGPLSAGALSFHEAVMQTAKICLQQIEPIPTV